MLEIRPLRPADLPSVLRIQDACYAEIVPESARSMAAKVEASPATCFVAVAGSDVVAYVIGVPVVWPRLPALDAPACEIPSGVDTFYLHDLAVSGQARGTGAAGRLVEAALGAAEALGLQRAGLVAIQGSARFWGRHGFVEAAASDAAVAAKLASYGAGATLMVREGLALP